MLSNEDKRRLLLFLALGPLMSWSELTVHLSGILSRITGAEMAAWRDLVDMVAVPLRDRAGSADALASELDRLLRALVPDQGPDVDIRVGLVPAGSGG
ncbi:hypothetical protein, partial [Frankia sp. Cr1]|uniref:hypothetical protein n=1 Tax=Frankia sp. Cr1 TaxID=3073931 RepID=UPI002AD56E84